VLGEKLYANGDFVAFRIINGNGEDAPWQDFTGTATIAVKMAAGSLFLRKVIRTANATAPKTLTLTMENCGRKYNYNLGDLQVCRSRSSAITSDRDTVEQFII
jgi:hypothetical protein